MDVQAFSKRYIVRCLNETDVSYVFRLCQGNPQYYQHCPPFVTEESIMQAMQALPPRKTIDDKYYVGFFEGSALIAVMDYIHQCPDEQTGFIGFFMLEPSIQGEGIGSLIIEEFCAFLAQENMCAVRLGWIHGNRQAEHFWHKNHFKETGETYDTERYTIILGERTLCSKEQV